MSDNYTIERRYPKNKCYKTYTVSLSVGVEDKTIKRFDSLAKRKGGRCLRQGEYPEYVFYTEEDAMTFCIGIDAYFDLLKGKSKDYAVFVALDELCSGQSYPWGVELYEILRYIIEEVGSGILGDIRLVGILDALGAFNVPVLRYIFRSIISDGYVVKLVKIGELGDEAQDLCNEYVNHTGFAYANVYAAFQYIAYGLGWIEKPYTKKEIDILKRNGSNIIPLMWNKCMDNELTDMFFQSITVYEYWKEFEIMAKMKELRFYIDDSRLWISCTLHYCGGLDFASLHCLVYNYNGDVKEDGVLGIPFSSDTEPKREGSYRCKTNPSQIGKIKLFWMS